MLIQILNFFSHLQFLLNYIEAALFLTPVKAQINIGPIIYSLSLMKSFIQTAMFAVASAGATYYAGQTFLKNKSQDSNQITAPLRFYKPTHNTFIHYSTLFRTPLAVHQKLKKEDFGDPQQDISFQLNKGKDPFVENEYLFDYDQYKIKDYVPCFLAAPRNHRGSESFIRTFANLVYQKKQNLEKWKQLEMLAQKLVMNNTCESIELISGPIYKTSDKPFQNYKGLYIQNSQPILGKSGPAIPTKLYKIIKCNNKFNSYASAFVVLNEAIQENIKVPLTKQAIDLETVSSQTGLNFRYLQGVPSLIEMLGKNDKKLQDFV